MNAVTIAHLLAAVALGLIVPLGWSVLGVATPGRWTSAVRLGAAASVLVPHGRLAALLAAPWLLVAGMMAARELDRWARRPKTLSSLARLAAMGWLAMAAVWLLADRGGWPFLGYSAETVAFTVTHFLNAGFGVAVLTYVVAGRLRRGRLATLVSALTLGGPCVVAIGFMTSGEGSALGTAIVASGVILLSLTTLGSLLREVRDGRARVLLGISSYVWLVSMPLAILYAMTLAMRETVGFADAPSYLVMAAVHGSLNELGFIGCGLLGWRLAARSPTRGVRNPPSNERMVRDVDLETA